MTIATVLGADATHDNIASLPKGQAAGYATGSAGVPWDAADWAAHPGAVHIAQAVDAVTDEHADADVLDVETGAATLADVAPWAKSALASYKAVARPGQRTPAVYASLNNITPVANALVAGGVTSGVGLWVAHWGLTVGQAEALVATAGGPFPIVAVQYNNAGAFDEDVFSVAWLANVSKKTPPVVPQVPPGQWKDAQTWTWHTVSEIGVGLDGLTHQFDYDTATGGWVRVK